MGSGSEIPSHCRSRARAALHGRRNLARLCRPSGAIVITRRAYIDATGDRTANEGAIWLDGRVGMSNAEASIRASFARADSIEILTSGAVRERSLQIFDRAFAITYALEAIAVIIGLTGVSFAAGSTALARRGEFGMLRHIGCDAARLSACWRARGFS